MGLALSNTNLGGALGLAAYFLQLLAQLAEPADQRAQVDSVNHPGRDVSGKQKPNSVHLAPRLNGMLAFAVTPDPTSDSIACASSTSHCNNSSRKRDQHTRNAKQRNAIQLMSSV